MKSVHFSRKMIMPWMCFFGRHCSTCFITDPNILVLLGSNNLHFVAAREMEGAFLRLPGGGGRYMSKKYFKVS